MILCCGEALIDMLPRESTQGEPAFAPLTGGAVFNTAIALGRLNAPSGYFGGLSNDLFGKQLTESLNSSNVNSDLAARSNRPTTLAFVTLTNGHAEYAFYDEGTAGRMLTEADLPELTSDIDALFFGGISLVSEPGADAYAALCDRTGDDQLVMMDPNIRPSFIADEARHRARLNRMLAKTDVVKASDEDLEWLGETAESLLSKGIAVVLITRGSDGVDVVTKDGTSRIPAQKAEVVDTVGAGDTFNAGFLAGLHRDGLLKKTSLHNATLEELTPAVSLGVAAAAITVSRAGANPPWEHEI